MSDAPGAPDWLTQSEVGMCPCGCIGKRKKGSHLDKTIVGASNVLRQAMFTDDMAARDGLMQRLDPRAKIVGLIVALIAAAFVRHIPVLVGTYVLALVLALASRLSLTFFVKRVWLFIPIFTGIVVLPATLNVITPGHIVLDLGSPLGWHLGFTSQGLSAAGLIVMRVATSISFVVLVTITTPWAELLAALRALKVPKTFVLIIGMAYRYLFVLLGTVTDMFVARKARTFAPEQVKGGRAFVMSSAGALFGKAHGLSEEVYQAMVARGWSGDARTLRPVRIGALDASFMLACVAFAVLVIGGDRALGL